MSLQYATKLRFMKTEFPVKGPLFSAIYSGRIGTIPLPGSKDVPWPAWTDKLSFEWTIISKGAGRTAWLWTMWREGTCATFPSASRKTFCVESTGQMRGLIQFTRATTTARIITKWSATRSFSPILSPFRSLRIMFIGPIGGRTASCGQINGRGAT